MSLSNSSHGPSNSRARRAWASIRKWKPHFGHTCWPSSSVLRQVIWPHLSHLIHRLSVFTFRLVSSGPSGPTPGFWRVHQLMSYTRFTLARVRMAPQGREGAVELLSEHGTRQLVRKSHGRER